MKNMDHRNPLITTYREYTFIYQYMGHIQHSQNTEPVEVGRLCPGESYLLNVFGASTCYGDCSYHNSLGFFGLYA